MAGVREFKSRLEQGRIRLSVGKGKIVIYYLADGEFQKIQEGLYPVGSTDRCNALSELLSWRLVHQGFSRPLVELSGDGAELGLAERR